MQVSCRRLSRHEIDHELLWLSVSVSSLGIAAVWFSLDLPWPRCVFHELTGLPCLTCGMTRSAIAFFHGRFVTALQWNPLIFALLCGVIAFDLYAFAVVAMRTPRLRILFRSAGEKQVVRIIMIAALVLNWIYLLWHWRDF